MPAGRPTDYNEEMCPEIIELMRGGASIMEVCLELDISRDTFYRWKKLHPLFSDTIRLGTSLSQGWWEKQGRVGLDGSINSTMWFMNMKNRFGKVSKEPEDEDLVWKDKQEVEAKHSGNLTMTTILTEIYGDKDNEKQTDE